MSPHPENPDCSMVLERLDELLDRSLEPVEAGPLATHIGHCPECAAEHRLATQIRRELRELPELDAPAEVLEDLFLKTTRRRAPSLPWNRLWLPSLDSRWIALATASALVVALCVSVVLDRRPMSADGTDPMVARATLEARYALSLLGRASHRTGLELRHEILGERVFAPLNRETSQSLERALRTTLPEERSSV